MKQEQAFPTTEEMSSWIDNETGRTIVELKTTKGMTLRDYFASKAMQGMLVKQPDGFVLASSIVELSYQFADAMLEEREK